MTIKLKILACAAALLFVPAIRAQQPAVPAAYQIQFILHEHQTGKPDSTRTFALTLQPGSKNELKAGDQVPVKTSPDKYDYRNTGIEIDCRLASSRDIHPGSLPLHVQINITSVVASPSGGSTLLPIMRNANASIDTVVPLGQPTSVAKFSDLANDAGYELEIVARAAPMPQ
ncbi:MAG TPA: hypothetical protein VNE83_03515 [Terriglobales bacterium]|nr:hypothetical protein [Terriglobales bacterium]